MSPTGAATLTPAVSESDHAEGSARAGVTLVEYGDYQCPYCGSAYAIVKQLQKAMGKGMRFVFRNFPLKEAHPHALHAAIAAEAAGLKGESAFWKMHDALYEHQRALDDAHLVEYAKAVGVSAEEIAASFAGGPAADRVRADFRSGIRSGVNGTPTFFVNGVRYDEDWTDIETLLTALRAAAGAAV
ncbi:MAG TPA: thioredoxin domain-containing protein [Gemmatimonadaceae bacterium]|nr:thioredoxin domain-containing protein [Gemmatimonadaceae bacterium]